MPAVEQIIAQEHNQPTAAPQQSAKQARSRQSDDGPEILPCMEHFVTLVRKAKRPGLALLLVERASATSLPEVAALTDACLLYTSPSPRDQRGSRMPSSA